MNKLVLSRAAREDLERIDDYTLNTFGLTQARKVLSIFEDTFEMLAAFPESAPERPEFDPPGRRFRYRTVLGSLLVVFESVDGVIRVARILDARRGDLRGLLDEEAQQP